MFQRHYPFTAVSSYSSLIFGVDFLDTTLVTSVLADTHIVTITTNEMGNQKALMCRRNKSDLISCKRRVRTGRLQDPIRETKLI